MGRFNIEGRWYDADDYKSARALHQQWKSGATAAADGAASTAALIGNCRATLALHLAARARPIFPDAADQRCGLGDACRTF